MRHPCNLCSLQFATEKILEKHIAYFHIKPDVSRVQPILPVVLEKIKIEPELITLDEEKDDDHQTASTVQMQPPKAIFEKAAITQIVKRLKPKDCYQCEVCLETFSLLRYFRKHLATAEEQGVFKCQEYYKTNINNRYLPVCNNSYMEGIANTENGQTTEKKHSQSRKSITAVSVQTCENSKDGERLMMKFKIGSKNNKQPSGVMEKQRVSNIVDNIITFQQGPKSYVEFTQAAKCAAMAVNDGNYEYSLVIASENQPESSTGNTEIKMPVLDTPKTLPTPQVTSCKECHLTCASYEQLCVHYSKHHNLPVVVLDHVEKHELYRKYKRHVESFSKNNIFKCDTCPVNFSNRFISKRPTTNGPCANCHFSDDHPKTSKNDISSIRIDKLKSSIDLCRKNIKKFPKEPYEPRENFATLSMLRKHNISTNGLDCHKCKTCKRKFSSSTVLRKHKLVVHNVKKASHDNVQQRQGKQFPSRKIRKRVRQVNSTNCHQCNVCQQKFSTQLQLTQHKVTAHQQSLFGCDLCQKKYKSKQCLTLHKLNVHEKFRFKCDLCKKDFTTKHYLKEHKRGAHDGFRHKCELCPQDFPLLVSLKQHKLTVHNGVRHKCESCSKTFTQLGKLNQHKRTAHDGVRRKCESCPKTFSRLECLNQHKRTVHDGVRYKCESCPKTFSRLECLNQHKRTVHDGVRNTCDICQKDFCSSGDLKQHKIAVHHVRCPQMARCPQQKLEVDLN